MSDTVHVGLVGGGGISGTHARAALAIPGVRIAAVQGANETKVRSLCDLHGGTPYTSLQDFLSHRPMDFVAIGSPSGLHAEQGIAAARAGLHVLVEKPIDISTERADHLIATAAAADVRLGVFFQDRFKPPSIALKRAIDAGRLGRPLLVEARVPWYRPPEYYSASRWRGTMALDGGGALINQAIHTLDLLLWLLGDIRTVQAKTTALLHQIEAEDSGAAILEFANGALGTFSFTTAAYPGYPRRVSITGERGTVVLEQDSIVAMDLVAESEGAIAGRAASPRRPSAARSESGSCPEPGPASASRNEEVSSPIVSDIEPHRAVIEDFIEAIRDGRPPRCDGREGRRSLAVIEAIYESSRRRQPIDVSGREGSAHSPSGPARGANA